ncbi:MAG: AAA family ATPase [Actinomycetota bacterium]
MAVAQRWWFSVPIPEVMNTAAHGASTSAVCQSPGSLIAYWPGLNHVPASAGLGGVIVWINGAFGAGKTTVATAVSLRLPGSMPYDPEMVGYFLGHVVPESETGDFQDLPIWRTMVSDLAIALHRHYGGPLVVPMTVVEPAYLAEIVVPIREAGVDVHLFTLDVPATTLRERITAQVMSPDDPEDDERIRRWRLDQVDRCVAALSEHDLGTPVSNAGRPPEDVAAEIVAAMSLSIDRGARARA